MLSLNIFENKAKLRPKSCTRGLRLNTVYEKDIIELYIDYKNHFIGFTCIILRF